MPYSEPKVRFLTTEHFKRYEKFYERLSNSATSVKQKIFLQFFGKDYKSHLDFLLKSNPKFGCYISNCNMRIEDYPDMMQNFMYPIFIAKVQKSIDSLSNFLREFKDLLGENHSLKQLTQSQEFKYVISKTISDYFKIDIYFWGVHYDLDQTGNAQNIKIISNKSYSMKEILGSFFTLKKDGSWVTDEEIFRLGAIDQQNYLVRFQNKYLKYREMVLENSDFEDKDPKSQSSFPDALIVGIILKPDLEKLVADTNQNIWKELKIQPEVLDALTSMDFHILGLEPIAIDCILAMNDLFK